MKKCKCGTENIDDAVFCRRCGQRLPLEMVQVSQVECSHCHIINPSEAIYCQNCGLSLKPNGKIIFSVNAICDVLVDNKIVKKDIIPVAGKTFTLELMSDKDHTIEFINTFTDKKVTKTYNLSGGEQRTVNIDLKDNAQINTDNKTNSYTNSNTGNYSSFSWDKIPWGWIIAIGIGIIILLFISGFIAQVWGLFHGIIPTSGFFWYILIGLFLTIIKYIWKRTKEWF